jgi:hypothetical protein
MWSNVCNMPLDLMSSAWTGIKPWASETFSQKRANTWAKVSLYNYYFKNYNLFSMLFTLLLISVYCCSCLDVRPPSICMHSWACNIKNVAPQKQNTVCKTRAQYAKRNCTFELFEVHCEATINAKNASFHKKNFQCKKTTATILIRYYLVILSS